MKTIFYVLVLPLFYGCSVIKTLDNLPNTVNQTEALLDDAIATISQESSSWQATLQNLETKLVGDAQSTVKTEVQQLANRTIAATGVELRCNADFLGTRVIQGLQRIKAELLQRSIPERIPVFCQVIPSEIRMTLAADRRDKIDITGYDFDNQPNLRLYLHANGRKTDVTSYINRLTHYQMILNLGNNGLVLDNQSNKITLEYNNQELSSIPVIQPQLPNCIREDYTFSPATITFVPPHTSGDTDFFGHGPRVDCNVSVFIDGNTVKASVYMKAQETGGFGADNSKAEGSAIFTIFTAPSNRKIERIVSDSSSSQSYTDGNLDDDYFNQGSGELVKRFVFTGDTSWGGEAGTKTKVILDFNRLTIHWKEVGNCQN